MKNVFVSRAAAGIYIAATALLCPASLFYGYVCINSLKFSQTKIVSTGSTLDIKFCPSWKAAIYLIGILLVLAVITFTVLGYFKGLFTKAAGIGSVITFVFMIFAEPKTRLSEYFLVMKVLPGLLFPWIKTFDMAFPSTSVKYCLWGAATLLFIISALFERFSARSCKSVDKK